MKGELREKFRTDLFEASNEDARAEVVTDFINDIESAFQNIKDNLDTFETMQDAYDIAEDYAYKLY